MEIIETRKSIKIACEAFGEKNHPHVLLVAGTGAPAEFWPESFCRDLASKSFYVIRYSHRDTGLSDYFDVKYTIGDMMDDMLSVMDHFGSKGMHIVGHSIGGYMAEYAMCEWPWKFISVTVISAGPSSIPRVKDSIGIGSATVESWHKLIKNKPIGNFDTDLSGWMELWHFLNGKRPVDEKLAIAYTRALYLGAKMNLRLRTSENHFFAMTTFPETLPEKLRMSHCPFLAIHGTDDPLIPVDNGKSFARYVPDAKIHLIEGAGYFFFDPAVWDEILSVIVPHFRSCY